MTRIRVTVLSVTDRVAFVPYEIEGKSGAGKASDSELRELIKQAAARFPVPSLFRIKVLLSVTSGEW
jgi:hypothetical protein